MLLVMQKQYQTIFPSHLSLLFLNFSPSFLTQLHFLEWILFKLFGGRLTNPTEFLINLLGVRYLAKRGGIAGLTPQDEVKCDMIAETCKDLLGPLTAAPFKYSSIPSIQFQHLQILCTYYSLHFRDVQELYNMMLIDIILDEMR